MPKKTYFVYDLETTGLNSRDDRIMQFAGQRADEDLNPIGEPYNLLVMLNDDMLPSPGALMITGITPQKTLEEGYTEAQFARILNDEIFTPDTIAVGFNNIRFDDEFVRHLFWRTFRDPYEWSWKDGRSRWDALDVVRMVRALRPSGIEWPFTDEGIPTNRLELLSAKNHIEHEQAHDALSDVVALIGLMKLIRQKQPQMFEYLLAMRNKNEVKKLVNLDAKQPFVYTSGKYGSEHLFTTVAFPLTSAPNSNVLVYDLREDPAELVVLSAGEISKRVNAPYEDVKSGKVERLPVKVLQYNRSPAVAPLSVLEREDAWQRLELEKATIEAHRKTLLEHPEFAENLRTAYENRPEFEKPADVEAQLYDGFLNDRDRLRVEVVRNATESELVDFSPEFSDERLGPLLLHYKARNYPKALTESESRAWETWRANRIQKSLPGFLKELEALASQDLDSHKQFVLEELKLWAENVSPLDLGEGEA